MVVKKREASESVGKSKDKARTEKVWWEVCNLKSVHGGPCTRHDETYMVE